MRRTLEGLVRVGNVSAHMCYDGRASGRCCTTAAICTDHCVVDWCGVSNMLAEGTCLAPVTFSRRDRDQRARTFGRLSIQDGPRLFHSFGY
jgi:hypothetical protein